MPPAIVPPPWKLSGSGYVFILLPRIGGRGKLDHSLDGRTVPRLRGFGVVMILDYSSSDAGPYRELLYIPGRVSLQAPEALKGHSISRIFVTTEVSRASGEKNWGIPKLLGDIRWGARTDKGEEISLLDGGGRLVLGIELAHPPRRGGGPAAISFPFSHRFLPRTLLQTMRGQLFSTTIEAAGRFRPVVGARMTGYGPIGEEIASRPIAAAFYLSEVHLRFPPPTLRIPLG